MENNKKEIEALKEEVAKLAQMIHQMREEKSEDIKKTVEEYIPTDLLKEIKEKLSEKIPVEKIDEIKEKISEKLPAIKEEGEQIVENVSEFTKKNPLMSLTIAFGVGLLLGKVLKK